MDKRHNYVKKIMELFEDGKLDLAPGTLSHLHVFHDDDCIAGDSSFLAIAALFGVSDSALRWPPGCVRRPRETKLEV